jgi:glycosyltransferase involved in cell wall biosynthesis
VTLFACSSSSSSAKIYPKWNKQLDITKDNEEDKKYQKDRLEHIISISNNYNVIHNNDGMLPILNEKRFSCPLITTWHSPFSQYVVEHPEEVPAMERTTFVSISDSQRKGLPKGKFIATVYNGTVDFNDYKLGQGGETLVWIGRFNISKGVVDAIKIALQAKKKLILAGSITSKKQIDYFNSNIKNQIDHINIEFVGEVNVEQKNKILGPSCAFLMPIHWEEPFGLVMIESMACGTPVVAYNRGSVPEIIEDGKNGYIVPENDIDGMVNAIKNIDKIDRKYCRESVRKRFSIEKMVSGYEKVYEKVIKEYEKNKRG